MYNTFLGTGIVDGQSLPVQNIGCLQRKENERSENQNVGQTRHPRHPLGFREHVQAAVLALVVLPDGHGRILNLGHLLAGHGQVLAVIGLLEGLDHPQDGVRLRRKFMSCSHRQELGQLTYVASD